jgi:hypothetical protein
MQVQSSKKTKIPATFFSKTKIGIIAAAFMISLLFLTHNYFLNDHNVLQKQSNSLLNDQESKVSQGVIVGNGEKMNDGENDVYFGPIKLKNSGYIGDSLDSFVEENSSTSTPSGSDQVRLGGENKSDISLGEFFHHPIASVSDLSTSLITDYVNNGRRATLLKLVDAVSRYYITYNTFPRTNKSEASYDWVEEMVEKNEMSGVYSYVLQRTSPVSDCGDVEQTGYCYDSSDNEAIIYVQINQYSQNPFCDDSRLFLLWSSADNRLGEVCLENPPTSLSGFTYLKEQ